MCLAPQPQASTPHTGKTPSCGMLLRLPMGIAQQIPNATNYCSRKVLPSAWSNADQGKQKKLVLSAAGESNSASTQESSFGPKKNVACHLCSMYCGKAIMHRSGSGIGWKCTCEPNTRFVAPGTVLSPNPGQIRTWPLTIEVAAIPSSNSSNAGEMWKWHKMTLWLSLTTTTVRNQNMARIWQQ